MKKFEFETSKGIFVLIDFPNREKKNVYMNKIKGINLDNITEEQAKEILIKFEFCDSYIDELYNRIRSKGVNLFFNPLGSYETALKRHLVTGTWQEFEDKTFYNPFLFPVIK